MNKAHFDVAQEALEICEDAVEILEVAILLWNEEYPYAPDEVFTDLRERCIKVIARASKHE